MKKLILALLTLTMVSVAGAEDQGDKVKAKIEEHKAKLTEKHEEKIKKLDERLKKHEEKKAERQQKRAENQEKIKAACSEELAKTNCSGEGVKLLKCVRDYKKTNKDFKFGESCKNVMKGLHSERKERKEKRKAAKE